MKIVNIVATAKLSAPLDLAVLSRGLKGCKPFSNKFPWLSVRLPPENHYVAFYKSGRFLITGIKSLDEINKTAERVKLMLDELDLKLNIESIFIHNVVFVDKIKLNLSLEKICHLLDSDKVSYEPEQFPSLIYKDFGATFLLFANGKVIITGLKNIDQSEDILEKFTNLLF